MGWRERLGLVRDAALVDAASRAVYAGEVVLPSGTGISATGDVAKASTLPVSVAAAFGINLDSDRVTRDAAMKVPAVRRGREVIAGTIGSAALRAHSTTTGARVPRPFLDQPSAAVTRSALLTWTVDDLLFGGASWWRVLTRDTAGYPLTAERVAPQRVSIDGSRVRIDGRLVADRDVIRFDSNGQGVLVHGGRALSTAILLEDAVRRFSRLDVPLGLITDEDGSMTDAEVLALLTSWELARRTRTTGYLPQGLSYQSAALDAQKIELGQARGYMVAEVGRLLNLPPSVLNAPTGDSLTYATTESNRRELVDLTLRPLMTAVEQRLSMPDVTPPGAEVKIDLTRFLLGDTSSVITAGSAAVSAGLMTVDEVRTEWLGLSPRGGEFA